MGIRLISKEERLSCKIEGVTFFYRRPLPTEIQEITDKHTSRGNTDSEAVGNEIMQRCILGWEGPITMGDGKDAEFHPDRLTFLPPKVQMGLAGVITENVDGKHTNVDPI